MTGMGVSSLLISSVPLEVVQEQGEEADVEHLADELHGHILVPVHGPEDAGERDVDRHQHGGQERHVAGQQPKTTVDVAAEGLGEAVDDCEVVHVRSSNVRARLRHRRQTAVAAIESAVVGQSVLSAVVVAVVRGPVVRFADGAPPAPI
jgi:hypothetical protein